MKITNLIAIVMAVSAALVALGGILNSASVVAIFTGVVGLQGGGWYGIVALLLGLTVIALFVYAYRQSIWNWRVRGALIALSGTIFLVSAIGMADNLRTDFSGRGYSWKDSNTLREEITIRTVPETFVVLDLDFVVLMMLAGSIGIAAAALWGAFRWESAKIEESQQEGIRGLLDELPPGVLQAGANYREELERHYGSPSRTRDGQPGATSPSPAPPPSSGNRKRQGTRRGVAGGSHPASPPSSGSRKRCPPR